MGGARDNSIWPIICVLICLFVLSAVSPRAWERAMKDRGDSAVADAYSRSEPLGASTAREWDGTSGVVPQLSAIPPLVQVPDQGEVPVDKLLSLNKVAEPAARVARLPDLAGPEKSELVVPDNVEKMAAGAAPADSGSSLDTPKADVEIAAPEEALSASEANSAASAPAEVAEPASASSDEGLKVDELAVGAWCEPAGLIEYLRMLSPEPRAGLWAQQVDAQLQQLRTAMGTHSDEAMEIVGRLGELCREADRLAAELGQEPWASEMRRVGYALDRRTKIWTQVLLVGGPLTIAGRRSEPDRRQLAHSVAEVETLIDRVAGGEGWRGYLELDALRALGAGSSQVLPQLLAAEVLRRLTRVPMTPEQQQIASSKPIVCLVDQLRNWASEPVEIRRLLESVERYEQSGLASDARVIATDRIYLMSSPVLEERGLGDLLEGYYRNANFRLTFTADLLNRLLPDREPMVEQVNDRVLGKPVYGQAMTTTNVAFRLIPDAYRLRAALEIHGQVASETSSNSGPATLYNSSWSDFVASKEIELGLRGVTLWPARAQVQNQTRLRGVSTDLDGIPLLGAVAQGIARSQAEEKQPDIRRELEWKLTNRVKEQIDREADVRMVKASERLKERFFKPLSEMALGPTIVSAKTTADRMTMRVRLATPDELGAHTPRPRAMGNSLASMQIHESALNNMVEQLELNGQTLTLAELRQRIAERLNRPEMLDNESEHDGVAIAFAPENAVQIRCQDGQLLIQVSAASLHEPGTDERWENFQVRAFYRPHINGRRAEFAREGVIQLVSEGLNMRSQIALRGIFSKAFSKQRPFMLTPESVLADQRLAGLGVSQVIVDDGWISLALGPQGRAADPMVARLPKTDEE